MALVAFALVMILWLFSPNVLIYSLTYQTVSNIGDLILLIIMGIIALFGIVGFIMAVIVGSLKLKDRYGVNEFKSAVILYILSYIIVFILIFFALRKYTSAVDKAIAVVQSTIR